MKEIIKFKECRDWMNKISTISDLRSMLKVYGKISCGNSYEYISIHDFTIGFNKDSIYILYGKELIRIGIVGPNGEISAGITSFILDDILKMNTDEFYKFYFRKYGYDSVIEYCTSDIVKSILKQFSDRKCSIKNIFVSADYSSITVSGVKKNGTDFECNMMGCSKEDIIELIELTRIKPHINKRTIFEGYDRPYKPYYGTSTSIIQEAYKEFKSYCDCDEERARNINLEDDYLKDDEEEDYWEDN